MLIDAHAMFVLMLNHDTDERVTSKGSAAQVWDPVPLQIVARELPVGIMPPEEIRHHGKDAGLLQGTLSFIAMEYFVVLVLNGLDFLVCQCSKFFPASTIG